MYQLISKNLEQVRVQIAEAAAVVSRNPKDVKLVVVTKGHPIEAVEAALEAGVRVFGENYAEEGLSKILACSEWAGVEWHMIGHIQSRKARIVAENYDWVHSLDSLKLARRLDRVAGEVGRQLPVLLECNVSGEESKFGFHAWEEEAWPIFFEQVSQLLELRNLQIRGLMTMAPFLSNPEQSRPYFQLLWRLRNRLAQRFAHLDWRELSMGMSTDFQIAIQEGATQVRIGTAIMGPRTKL